jgi:hypothetical protein
MFALDSWNIRIFFDIPVINDSSILMIMRQKILNVMKVFEFLKLIEVTVRFI